VRVVGLLVILLAGPAFASEDRHEPLLARFAYANTAFQTSLERTSLHQMREPLASAIGEVPRSDLRPAMFVVAELLADQPATSPLTPVASQEAGAPEWRPLEWHFGVGDNGIEGAPPVRAHERSLSSPLTAQRLAALPEPLHLLTNAPSTDPIASEGDATARKPGWLTRSRASQKRMRSPETAHKARQRSKSSGRKLAGKSAKVPRWAEQMFENIWQKRAFAYQ
jgi:hypothetical protein